ncbi:LacI family DNA-binding transcriptional regulator [Sinomicrobium soli]|uniref:LacI family DNA-binding transcriptional regulator n=1 Tax=Sinomicrobium sp. N-1-3-6 TaxID=2219864 RepID=UPI000DCD6E1F|nr:substrate-binding domain-containing protein [Sinomicrobium sp. N-1-3-6]RAV30355.1 LacI family transcriptional regulator [Sinomicrobium sp. N-1-3-6]
MKNKVSLKDIAQKVGVSTATVSYVLSKGENSGVSEKVAERVRQVAKELNYQPNQIAKSLKMGKTFSIGLIVADISNPFFAQIARIVEDEAKKKNYTVIFGSSDERAEKSWNLIKFLSNRQVDGFIIAPTEKSEDQIRYLKEEKIPFVLIDRHFPEIPSNFVETKNYESSYKAVKRLIDTGNKNIAMIAYDNSLHHMTERIRGYRDALKEAELERHEQVYKVSYDNIEADMKEAISLMFSKKSRPEAIFIATNSLAVSGLKYTEQLGYKVGKDIAVISFDQGEAFDFFYSPLTFIRQPLFKIAQKATEILIRQINSKKFINARISLEGELIIRKSCQIT